jgi:Domain of unknown function (DUF4404)
MTPDASRVPRLRSRLLTTKFRPVDGRVGINEERQTPMTDPKLKELLNSLQDTLEQTERIDTETLDLVRELDAEIHRLTSGEAEPDDVAGVLDQAKSMETRFAVDHPVAEGVLREIIDALSRLGI